TFANGVILVTAGNQTVTATDNAGSSGGASSGGGISGISSSIAVSPPAARPFTGIAPSSAIAGLALNPTATGPDAVRNTATGYAGTVHFTTSDSGAGSLAPGDYTFVAGDNGVHTFTNGAMLVSAGNQTVTATDAGAGGTTGTSSGIAVSATAAASFSMSDLPA